MCSTRARELGAARICVVYGHGGEAVREAPRCRRSHLGPAGAAARHRPRRAAGAAASRCRRAPTLVLYGDVPLIGTATLRRLIEAAGRRPGAADRGPGRPERLRPHRARRRRAMSCASSRRRTRRTPSAPSARSTPASSPRRPRRSALAAGTGQRQRAGRVLPDRHRRGWPSPRACRWRRPQPDDAWEVLGVNSKAQLAELERICTSAMRRLLMEHGVTLADPARIDVRGELDCGRDVTIDVNCVFEGRVVLGDGVEVGAHCVLRNAIIGAGTRIAALQPHRRGRGRPRLPHRPLCAPAPRHASWATTCTSATSSR